jgi:hypothetical protein
MSLADRLLTSVRLVNLHVDMEKDAATVAKDAMCGKEK